MEPPIQVGRYELHGVIASGGLATVHYGRLRGEGGFSRIVAIKRLHARFAKDAEFVAMLLDEARLASRISHPNVAAVLDVELAGGELFLVMEYVEGETLARLSSSAARRGRPPSLGVVARILSGALRGLHAAHEAVNTLGEPLGLVHRDCSPHNIIVGVDGAARVVDFGVAKALGRVTNTREGHIKGKLAYMAPEQLRGHVTRQSDLFTIAIVLWEALTGRRLFDGTDDEVLQAILHEPIEPPSAFIEGAPSAELVKLDALTMRALERDPERRFATAREMALALEACVEPASSAEVSQWVEDVAQEALRERRSAIAWLERVRELPATTSRRRRALAALGFLALTLPVGLLVTRSAPPSPAPGPTHDEAPADVASASPEASAEPRVAPPKASARALPRRTAAPKGNCDPPFVTDAAGRKHFKESCFR